jgi:hypothetical protein
MISAISKKIFPSFFQTLSYIKFHRKNHRFFIKDDHPVLIVCFDDYGLHGGLADRLKGIISAYNLAIQNNYQFKIHFNHPFTLDTYLSEFSINWKAQGTDLKWSFGKTKFLTARDNPTSVLSVIQAVQKKRIKIFLYTNLDFLHVLYPNSTDTGVIWKNSFHKLFQPSALLVKELDKAKLGLCFSNETVGFHTRFTTLLGDFEDVTERVLYGSEYDSFMKIVWKKMIDIYKGYKLKHVLLFSDSIRFIEFVKKESIKYNEVNISIVPGVPAHSDRSGNDEETYLKTFLDFYFLSETKQIFLFKTGKMYASAFSKYAANVSGSPFHLIEF